MKTGKKKNQHFWQWLLVDSITLKIDMYNIIFRPGKLIWLLLKVNCGNKGGDLSFSYT